MSAPKRIQMRRTKGWRKPEGAVYVGRPTRWGNPIPLGGDVGVSAIGVDGLRYEFDIPMTAAIAVAIYRAEWESGLTPLPNNGWSEEILAEDREHVAEHRAALEQLRGHDLGCWCPLDQPCHADVLLDLANRPQ